MFDVVMLRKMMPSLSDAIVEATVRRAPEIHAKYGIPDGDPLAIMLGQFTEETGGGRDMQEDMQHYSAERIHEVWPSRFPSELSAVPYAHNAQKLASKVYNGRMGNRPDTTDGYDYRGRGLSQLTGRSAYEAIKEKFGIDVVSNPDLVLDPEMCYEIAVADIVMCGCLPYMLQGNILMVTKKLNGGTVGLAERQAQTARWKRVLATPHVAAPEDSMTEDEILELQQNLASLGYHEVGEPDGRWGSRTTGAVAAFQKHEHLPVNGHYDAATKEAMDSAVARPVSEARANTTEDDLADKGSQTVIAGQSGRLLGKIKAGLGGGTLIGGVASQFGAFDLDQAQDAVDKAKQAHGIWSDVHGAIFPYLSQLNHPLVLGLGVVLIVGGAAVWWYSNKVIAARVGDHQNGKHAGVTS